MTVRCLFICLGLALTAHAQTFRIALVTKGDSNEYWRTVHAGAVKAEQELSAQGVQIKLLWAAPPTESSDAEEAALVRGFAADNVSGIVLSPTNVQALVGPVKAAFDAGIPTVVIDSGLNDASQISFVATDNYNGGIVAARRVGALLHGSGRVILFRFLRHSAGTRARESGFLDTIENQFRGIQVVDSGHYAGATYADARKSAESLLRAEGTATDAIFCSNEIASVGMLQALRSAHLGAGKVKLVVFDASSATLNGLQTRDVQGIVVQNPFLIGYTGIETLVAHLRGRQVEQNIDTGCRLVTPENIDSPEIAELLHPPVDKYVE
jgi:ribose transport system substrate-binding protein